MSNERIQHLLSKRADMQVRGLNHQVDRINEKLAQLGYTEPDSGTDD